MRLHRFYFLEIIGAKTEVKICSSDLVNQIRRVFRLKTSDSVILFDGSGNDFTCRIEDIGKEEITFAVSSISKSHYMPDREIVLCAAIVKKNTFEWIVEKATELGVTKIIPVISERSEKKNLNEDRLKKIAIEASEQSGRGDVPLICPIISLNESVGLNESLDVPKISNSKSSCFAKATQDRQVSNKFQASNSNIQKIAFHLDGEILDDAARTRLTEKSIDDKSLAVFIGPEGGWSENEIDLFHKNNIHIYSLGNQVLRAETAVVSALSLLCLGK